MKLTDEQKKELMEDTELVAEIMDYYGVNPELLADSDDDDDDENTGIGDEPVTSEEIKVYAEKLAEIEYAREKEKEESDRRIAELEEKMYYAEENSFCESLIKEGKMLPKELTDTVKELVILRKMPSLMFSEKASLYDNTKAKLTARDKTFVLGKINAVAKTDEPFNYSEELDAANDKEFRAQLNEEVLKRVALNKTAYTEELRKIREGN